MKENSPKRKIEIQREIQSKRIRI